MNKRAFALLLLGLLTVLARPTAAGADLGVAISLAEVRVDKALLPGDSYHLPDLTVKSTSTERAAFHVVAAARSGASQTTPDLRWFAFRPPEFTLDAGETQLVGVSLDLPSGAPPGDYVAVLQAASLPRPDGMSVGVGAATTVYFSIKPATVWDVWRLRASHFIDGLMPWPVVLIGAAAVLLFGGQFRRRFRLRLPFERR